MKKWIACILVFLLLAAAGSAFAKVPEYPAVIDGLDFGGKTIYIYNWWTDDDEAHSGRQAEPDETTQKEYDYVDWLEATYNCKLVEKVLDDWAGMTPAVQNMVLNKDDSQLCVVLVSSDFVGPIVSNQLFMPWTVEAEEGQWNAADKELMTYKGVTYAVHAGATEPRHCIYFNKRVLAEAGIDYQTIYDAQANGTWTWDKMEELMEKVQRDTDNDGETDIYALTGNGDDLTLGLVFSNNGSFFDYNSDGLLEVTANKKKTIDALEKRKEWGSKYMAPQPEGSNWDWFREFWYQGNTAFFVGQTYQGFTPGSDMQNLGDDWGCVVIPKGPNATTYLSMVADNVTGIPNVYDDETAQKLQQIYALYSLDTPGVDTETNWIENKYAYTDDRAVDETYAMMREDAHNVPNYTYLLGSSNDILGNDLMWVIMSDSSVSELVEAAMPGWQALVDEFNSLAGRNDAVATRRKEEIKQKLNGFVNRCYELIMNRDSEEGGRNYWVGLLEDHTMTASQIINNFTSSAEFQSRPLTSAEKVDILYNTMLDREPDAGGRAFWIEQLDNGVPETAIINGFCTSAEFGAICDTYGIEPGTVEAPDQQEAGTGIEGFVRRCYKQALTRDADQGGVDYWVNMMRGGMHPKDVADNFVFSEELTNRGLSNDEFIKTMYRLYMGREADDGGLAYWNGLMDGGMSRQEVCAGFAGSAEFTEIVAGFGL